MRYHTINFLSFFSNFSFRFLTRYFVYFFGDGSKGEITISQAINQIERTSVSLVFGLGWGVAGASIGAAALSWIPVVGPVVGGLVGGLVGNIAGSKFGETIYNGVKAIRTGIKNACRAGINKLKSAGSWLKMKLGI